MIIQTLFEKVPYAQVLSKPNTNISGVSIDSNLVEPGDLFIPLVGKNTNGYNYINQAIERGAAAVAGDDIRTRKNHLASVYLPNASAHVSWISANVYGYPSRKLHVTGVTGTHGKTVTAHIIESFLRATKDNRAGYIGTTAYRWAKSHQEAKLTTPTAPQLQKIFQKMVESEIQAVVMECSSHGIHQGRLDYTDFDIAVFTNLGQDHLDYHESFVAYRNTKWHLFSSILENSDKKSKTAIFNLDDPTGRSWIHEGLNRIDTITYTTQKNPKSTIYTETFHLHKDGITAKVWVAGKPLQIRSPMIGIFNLQNILAGISVAHAMNLDMQVVEQTIEQGVYVPGRMEKIQGTKNFHVYIDFAHTDESLSIVLDTLNRFKEKRVITVFGCGGETEIAKRSAMGRVASEKSDVVFVTTDNPRNEDPKNILDDIFMGIDKNSKTEIFRIPNREEAIVQALQIAQKGDIILIAGKGHETYQEISGIRHPFDDKKVVKTWLKQK